MGTADATVSGGRVEVDDVGLGGCFRNESAAAPLFGCADYLYLTGSIHIVAPSR